MSDERICLASAHGLRATQTDAMNLIQHIARYRFACDSLPTYPVTVLDAGCGTGYGSWLLSVAGHDVIGVDIDPGAIDYAEHAYGAPCGPNFICTDLLELTLDCEFGGIVCVETLEHLPEPDRAMDVLVDYLADDGVVLCSTPINRTGESGPSKTNPFHLHEYALCDFMAAMLKRFKHVNFFRQESSAFLPIRGTECGGFVVAVARGPK